MSIRQDIAIPKTLEDFVQAKEKAFNMVKQARDLLDAAEQEMNEIGHYIYPHDGRPRMRLEEIERHINQGLWRASMDKTGFRQLLDNQAEKEFNDSLEKDCPNFTIENIKTQFLSLYQNSEEMFNRGLINVFKSLDHSYRTNEKEPFKVGKKLIVGYMVSNWLGYLQVSYSQYSSGSARINDLDRVFKTLDEKEHNPRELENAINAVFKEGENIYQDEYYRIKGFKNGNMHIEFLRADLLEKANDIIAKHWGDALPDARAA